MWIARDPVFAKGFEYLQDRGSDLKFSVAYAWHEKAEDLGDLERKWYEQQVVKADYYGYESLDSTTEADKSLRREGQYVIQQAFTRNEIPTRDHFFKHEASKSAPDTFHARVIAALALSGTTSFSFDPASDGTAAEQATLQAFRAVMKHPDEEVAARAHIALHNAREWCAVGRIGAMLLCHEGNNNTAPVKSFMTIGIVHGDISRKLSLQGVDVKGYHIKTDRPKQNFPEDVKQVLKTGIILSDDMPMLTSAMRNVRDGANYFNE